MKKLFTILVFSYIAYLVFTTSCANVGMPTGGDKDSIPPVVIRTVPAFNARNHTDPNISITFDEFIIATDVSTKLIVSPPLKTKPLVRTKSRTLTINLGDSLRQNRTYSLDFQNSIVDNNEKNPLTDFRFAFSTGPDFDSLMVGGYVINAHNIEPIEGAVVMVYADTDTVPPFRTSIPDYIAMTNEEGFYALSNIAPGKYHLFALEDEDNSLTFNQIGERIAFYDSLVVPVYPKVTKTIDVDSLAAKIAADSLLTGSGGTKTGSMTIDDMIITGKSLIDSLKVTEVVVPAGLDADSLKPGRQSAMTRLEPHYLLMFTEVTFDQFLEAYGREARNMVHFYFSNSVTDSFRINLLSPSPPASEWSYLELNQSRDSIIFWVNDTVISRNDTLKLQVQYNVLDSLRNLAIKIDTLSLVYTEPKQRERRRKKDEKEVPSIPHFSFRLNAGDGFDQYNPLVIEAPEPLSMFDHAMAALYQTVDTLEKAVPFTIEQDSLLRRKFRINYPWEFEGQYRIAIDSAAAMTFTGMPSNTVNQKFTIQKEGFYGRIFLEMLNVPGNSIVQLLKNTEKEEVVKSARIAAGGRVEFAFVKPDKYKIRLIVDRNNNGVWDTGNLDERRQPERIVYFSKIIKIKSNFDHHESWTLPDDLQTKKELIDEDQSGKDAKKPGGAGKKPPR